MKNAIKKVMVFGTFDIVHPGHIYFLKEAKKKGNYLIVIVARDKNVKKIKGNLPEHNEKSRLAKMSKLGLGNKIMLGDKDNKYNIVDRLKPDIICLGYDQDSLDIEKKYKDIKINRIKSYKTHMYKSSKLK